MHDNAYTIKNTNLKQTENYTTTKSEYKKIYGTEYNYDISFVGNLYDKNRYDDTMHILPDYLCGYMDAAIEAQLNVNGGNLLKNMLTPEIIDMLSQYTDVKASTQSHADLKFHFATSVLAHKTAAKMRIMTLNSLAMKYPGKVHLFTTSDTSRKMANTGQINTIIVIIVKEMHSTTITDSIMATD